MPLDMEPVDEAVFLKTPDERLLDVWQRWQAAEASETRPRPCADLWRAALSTKDPAIILNTAKLVLKYTPPSASILRAKVFEKLELAQS